MGKLRFKLLLSLGAFVLCLLSLEAVARFARPYLKTHGVFVVKNDPEDLAEYQGEYAVPVTTVDTKPLSKEMAWRPEMDKIDRSTVFGEAPFVIKGGTNVAFQPGAQFHSYETWPSNGQPIFDLNISIDEYGRRKNPLPPKGRLHSIFWGCPFTFGQGVRDDQTLPYYFALENPQYNSYNFGIPGGSAATALLQVQTQPWTAGIPEAHGIGVYIFIDAHVDRARGHWTTIGTWGSLLPYFREVDSSEFQFVGSYAEARPWLTKLSQFAMGSSFFQWWEEIQRNRWTEEDMDRFARQVAVLKDHYTAAYPGNDFYFVFFPDEKSRGHRLRPYLNKYKIKYLAYDPSLLRKISNEKMQIDGDGYPSAEAYKVFAHVLSEDIGRDQRKKIAVSQGSN